jgi:hypothetical protein
MTRAWPDPPPSEPKTLPEKVAYWDNEARELAGVAASPTTSPKAAAAAFHLHRSARAIAKVYRSALSAGHDRD